MRANTALPRDLRGMTYEPGELLCTAEVAALSGRSQHSISELCPRNRLPSVRLGGRYYVRRGDAERLRGAS